MNATPATVPKTYAELRRGVEQTLLTGQRLIEQAKVRTYHETGWLIREHLRLHEEESNHGTQTMRRLAADLKVSESVLYRCVRFVECFPILATWPKLTWAHYRTLVPIADPKLRRSLATEANRNAWSVVRLQQRILELAPAEVIEVVTPSADRAALELLMPKRGQPGLHPIVDRGDGPAVDLGFKLYQPLDSDQAKRFAKGDIVRLGEHITRADDATKADLFTYAATLRRVVDGDTLLVALEVAPGIFIEQKLRLRGLDCPEMKTPEGKVAKRFVDALVAKTTAVTINTTKPDKYDRYLADVFLELSDQRSAVSGQRSGGWRGGSFSQQRAAGKRPGRAEGRMGIRGLGARISEVNSSIPEFLQEKTEGMESYACGIDPSNRGPVSVSSVTSCKTDRPQPGCLNAG